jgi:hypothetical protein
MAVNLSGRHLRQWTPWASLQSELSGLSSIALGQTHPFTDLSGRKGSPALAISEEGFLKS